METDLSRFTSRTKKQMTNNISCQPNQPLNLTITRSWNDAFSNEFIKKLK